MSKVICASAIDGAVACQKATDRVDRNTAGVLNGISVRPATDGRKGDGGQIVGRGQLEAVPIA